MNIFYFLINYLVKFFWENKCISINLASHFATMMAKYGNIGPIALHSYWELDDDKRWYGIKGTDSSYIYYLTNIVIFR